VEFVVDKVALEQVFSEYFGPGSNSRLVKWDLWWTKWCWGRFSPSTSVSPANLHSTKFSIIIITRGRYNRPLNGRRAEWTQLGLHPPLCELKKKEAFTDRVSVRQSQQALYRILHFQILFA
jgi:hypothetical protein